VERKVLFNPAGSSQGKILGGSPTNLIELSRPTYPWAAALYRQMREDFWLPEEVALGDDHTQFPTLPPPVQEAFLRTLAFLIFLDSVQSQQPGILAEYVTDPIVDLNLRFQAMMEGIHAQSYDYILTSVVDPVTRDRVYEWWREDPLLAQRNQVILDRYDQFLRNPTEAAFVRTCVADLCLEGIYFYSGFLFFAALGRRQWLNGTVSILRLIRRDELLHVGLFKRILAELRREQPDLFTPAFLEELRAYIAQAVEEEVQWSRAVLQDQIPGLPADQVAEYLWFYGNQRCQDVGVPPVAPTVRRDPFPWVAEILGMSRAKTDFFEGRVVNYSLRSLPGQRLREALRSPDRATPPLS